MLANNLISALFSLLSLDLERRNSIGENNKKELGLLDDADNFIKNAAKEIRSIVFPYRQNNPIRIEDLVLKITSNNIIRSISLEQFKQLLVRLSNQGYLSGVLFTGNCLYIDEEHYSWKTQIHIESKAKVASKAMELIKSHQNIALDAGSATLELTKQLCQGLLMRIWTGITIITNSIPAANILLETSSKLGLLDSNDTLNVYISGGRVRPNTLAIIDSNKDGSGSGIQLLFDEIGKADIAFIGTNGISLDKGFTTHSKYEVNNKRVFINNSNQTVILGNSQKFGIEEKLTFAGFDEKIILVTDEDTNYEIIEDYTNKTKLNNFKTSIIRAM